MRKLEFGVGKTGIGPFALNVTNMSLTQAVHLTMDYGANEFGLGSLDEIQGEDRLRIADWLSAMVNAHVDVAKDAYVFDLNVNKATYNHTNLLLRAGKGKATFLFMAQPYLKKYADSINNASGIYGSYLDESSSDTNVYESRKKRLKKNLIKQILNKIDTLAKDNESVWTKEQTELIQNVLYYYKRELLPEKVRE
uniref:Uncharacterized protein n=1 Tax=Dulem virus 42 TaxID=3145760 RepID=A0AAU8B9X9_9CAUD